MVVAKKLRKFMVCVNWILNLNTFLRWEENIILARLYCLVYLGCKFVGSPTIYVLCDIYVYAVCTRFLGPYEMVLWGSVLEVWKICATMVLSFERFSLNCYNVYL